jgi:ATP-dependent RNA helicase RhlE
MLFSNLALHPQILATVKAEGYETATPIQEQAMPHVLAGRDVLGCAQTGTGKTAAFAMPILHRLAGGQRTGHQARCLVLCPTRELALQIAESFSVYGRGLGLRHVTIFGGVSQNSQVDALRRGVDIIVATPGRLEDLMQQRVVDLGGVKTLVLDEADRMLDMGFIQPIRRITGRLPGGRQTLLFSATMPVEIRRLADQLLSKPAVVQVAPVASTAAQIDERVYRVESRDKPALLAHLVKELPMHRTIVFTRTKHGADRVVRDLHKNGIKAEAIHGNKSQNARVRALANFSNDKIPVLVATDIASRGIDVEGISHVVNFDLTHEPETYVHRIGRTARAGASGMAISFCSRDESSNLRAIERLIRRTIDEVQNPLPSSAPHDAHPLVARQHTGGGESRSRSESTHRREQHAPRPERGGRQDKPKTARPSRVGAGVKPHASAGRTASHPMGGKANGRSGQRGR